MRVSLFANPFVIIYIKNNVQRALYSTFIYLLESSEVTAIYPYFVYYYTVYRSTCIISQFN